MPNSSLSERTNPYPAPALWLAPLCVGSVAGLLFLLYSSTLAPGLTWAHQGADGGELLAAAVSNGVPHPPGYPLYMLLLQGWLRLTQIVMPAADLAWRGNLLSALLGALAAAWTTATVANLLTVRLRWPLAAVAGLAWGISPLLWSQSIITEVYALHALIVALLGWSLLAQRSRPWLLSLPVALGTAHHPTFFLLLPAVLYWLWSEPQPAPVRVRRLLAGTGWIALGVALGALFMLRTVLAARGAPPINWGDADGWQGLVWLVSGAAYRSYLFAAAPQTALARLAAWASTLGAQYGAAGLVVAIGGLAWLDGQWPRLRTFSLWWIVPVSIYTIGYATRDSHIYLLPVGWIMALWLAVALEQGGRVLAKRTGSRPALTAGAGLIVLWLGVSLLWRWPAISLRHDSAARDFVAGAAAVLPPNAIIVSRSDAETFALWYGTWGSGELLHTAPGLVPVNDSLYQFDWYARLQAELHPGLPGVGTSAAALISANAADRPIFFAEMLPDIPEAQLEPLPPLWRFAADSQTD